MTPIYIYTYTSEVYTHVHYIYIQNLDICYIYILYTYVMYMCIYIFIYCRSVRAFFKRHPISAGAVPGTHSRAGGSWQAQGGHLISFFPSPVGWLFHGDFHDVWLVFNGDGLLVMIFHGVKLIRIFMDIPPNRMFQCWMVFLMDIPFGNTTWLETHFFVRWFSRLFQAINLHL